MSVVLLHAPDPIEQLPLPLTWDVAPGVPAVPPAPRHLRLVAGTDVDPVPDRAPTLEWVARMARAVAEVGCGERPSAQLAKWVDRQQLARLAARGVAVRQHPSSRGRAARTAQQVRSIRVCPIVPGVAETSAVLVGTGRAQAVALRFEHIDERWLVTAFSLG